MTRDRVEWHLGNWGQWMAGGNRGSGYSFQTPGMVSGNSQSFEDLAESADRFAAIATDACIAALESRQQAAIHHIYLDAVWVHQTPVDWAYDSAVDRLQASLAGRGLV